jgi:hypothetical protein
MVSVQLRVIYHRHKPIDHVLILLSFISEECKMPHKHKTEVEVTIVHFGLYGFKYLMRRLNILTEWYQLFPNIIVLNT